MADGYAVLGIHGEDVESVDVRDENGNLIEKRNVVRVRMEIGNQIIDEDFVLPRVITIEEQINDVVNKRINEIRAGHIEQSAVVDHQPERVVSQKTESDFNGIAAEDSVVEGVENV